MLIIFTKRSRVLNMQRFWTYLSSKYTCVSEDARGFEYVRVNRVGICLNIPDYVWLNMHEYTWKCRYMREYDQICQNGFCFVFPYCNTLSTWTRASLFQRLHKSRSFSEGQFSKGKWCCFSETEKFIFSIVAVILFDFVLE